MKPLDKLAAELFQGFAMLEGKVADWNYLSEERKKAWKQDVLLIGRYFTHQLKKEVKPLPTNMVHSGYEAGFLNGQRTERLAFQSLVESLYEQLEEEYDNLNK